MDLLTFHLGDREFGVDLGRVLEILNPPPITRVPEMPPALLGLMGLRGDPTGVVDAGLRLEGRAVELSGRTPVIVLRARVDDREVPFGLLCEAAGRRVSVERLLPWSDRQADLLGRDACVGFAEVDGRLVLVLDVDRLLIFPPLPAAPPRSRERSAPVAPAPSQPRAAADAEPRGATGGSGGSTGSGREPAAGPPPLPVPAVAALSAPLGGARSSSAAVGVAHAPQPPARVQLPDAERPTTAPPPPRHSDRGGRSAPAQAAARSVTERARPTAGGDSLPLPVAAPPASATPTRQAIDAPAPLPAPSPRPDPAAAPAPFPLRPRSSDRELPPPPPRVTPPATRASAELDDAPSLPPPPPGVRIPGLAWGALAALILLALILAVAQFGGGEGRGRRSPPIPARQEAAPAAPAPLSALSAPPPVRALERPLAPATTVDPVADRPAAASPSPEPPPAPTTVTASASAAASAPQPPAGPPARKAGPIPQAMRVTPDTPACEIHEVRKGDTLWWISAHKLGSPYRWPELFGENRGQIVDPDVIEVHDRIRIPGGCAPSPAR